jgi:excisionase family DNA binding protein
MNYTINGKEGDSLLTEVDAARFLRISSRTLQAWRVKHYGPRFVRVGRAVRYRRQDLEDWVSEQTVRTIPAKHELEEI